MNENEEKLLEEVKGLSENSGLSIISLIDFKGEESYSKDFLKEAREIANVSFTALGASFARKGE